MSDSFFLVRESSHMRYIAEKSRRVIWYSLRCFIGPLYFLIYFYFPLETFIFPYRPLYFLIDRNTAVWTLIFHYRSLYLRIVTYIYKKKVKYHIRYSIIFPHRPLLIILIDLYIHFDIYIFPYQLLYILIYL